MLQNNELSLIGLDQFPDVYPDDSLSHLITQCIETNELLVQDGDIFVLAQKIVSKSEGRQIRLADVTPGEKAQKLAKECGKDPRLVELILSESKCVVRRRPGLIVVEHKNGFVHANAGIDCSNLQLDNTGDEAVLLLPENPDASAAKIHQQLENHFSAKLGIIINDTMGRAWRNGVVGHCIGCSGILAINKLLGQQDRYGRTLQSTEVAAADELAAAASLLMGQGAEGIPVVLVRGAEKLLDNGSSNGKTLIRDPQTDLFRDW